MNIDTETGIIAKGWVSTCGDGLWSFTKRKFYVKITASIMWFDGAPYGSLYAHFSKTGWDTDKLGLPYTDSKCENDVRKLLKKAGFKHWNQVHWSEQGMQGGFYLNFDMEYDLVKELIELED